MHGRHLWLDRRVNIIIDMIHQIMGLSNTTTDVAAHFVGKDQDKNIVARLIKKYNLTRGGREYDVMQIEDMPLWITV